MRKYKMEAELKAIAEKVAENITVRDCEHSDEFRPSTPEEKEIIYKVIYGSLSGLNWSEESRGSDEAVKAVIDTAEYLIDLFIPYCNGYLTVYNPLKRILGEWETV